VGPNITLKQFGDLNLVPDEVNHTYLALTKSVIKHTSRSLTILTESFGGLVVSVLASGTQDRGFKPGRSRWIFTDVKILSMPSSGGQVKESVPCLSFAACKRT
jgi:hypothetical protein